MKSFVMKKSLIMTIINICIKNSRYFITDAFPYVSIGDDTKTTEYHDFRHDEMYPFDNNTVKNLQLIYFQSKLIKFVLSYIPTFDTMVLRIKKNKKGLP